MQRRTKKLVVVALLVATSVVLLIGQPSHSLVAPSGPMTKSVVDETPPAMVEPVLPLVPSIAAARSGRVSGRVVDDESSQPAPVIRILLTAYSDRSIFPHVREDRIVTAVGSFHAEDLEPGVWEVEVESSDGRFGGGVFEISATNHAATLDVRVGPLRSLIARVVPDDAASTGAGDREFSVTAEPLPTHPWPYLLAATGRPGSRAELAVPLALVALDVLHMQDSEKMLFPPPSSADAIDATRRTRTGADGTCTFDHLPPGKWKLVAHGAHTRSERTVVVTTRADVNVTMYAKSPSESASLQLTNLDSRFEGPLYVRVEKEHTDPIEFVADPMNGRSQTFSVMSGESHLVVYPMHHDVPDVDAEPITRIKLDIAAGATEVVALYPR